MAAKPAVDDLSGRPEPLDHDAALRDRLRVNLDAHEVLELDPAGLRHAAVAVVVISSDAVRHGSDEPRPMDRAILAQLPGDHDPDSLDGSVAGTAGGAAIVLTRRGAEVGSHAGQWALPGGRIDENETPLAAALRETSEEIDLTLDESAVLGRLDDYATRSGYLISPFVVWADGDPELRPNPGEVSSIHRIGCHELLRSDSPRMVAIPESDRPVVQLPIGGDLIHAPTAAVVYQFRAVALDGRSERVDHLEQPVFAWR